MRFSIEQLYLTDDGGKLIDAGPSATYHVVDAENVSGALESFLVGQGATVVGGVQLFPGFQAVATARRGAVVFTVHLTPGSDLFHRLSIKADAPATHTRPRSEERRDEDEQQPRR